MFNIYILILTQYEYVIMMSVVVPKYFGFEQFGLMTFGSGLTVWLQCLTRHRGAIAAVGAGAALVTVL